MKGNGILLAVLTATVVLFAGCSGNIFSSVDQPEVPSAGDISNRDYSGTDASDADVTGFIDEIGELDSLGFVDSATATAAAEKLEDAANNTNLETGTRQRAATTAGLLRVGSNSNSVKLVNNVGTLVAQFGGEDGEEEPSPEKLMTSLVPSGLDEDGFTTMITNLKDSAGAFRTFAGTLNDTNGDGKIDESDDDYPTLDEGEKNDVIQAAMLSIAVDTALTALNDDDGDGDTTNELFKMYQDVSAGKESSVTFSGDDPFDDIESSTSDIGKIMGLAGLDFSDDEGSN
jgi:hypothetical protein